jgi:hypothetical protein
MNPTFDHEGRSLFDVMREQIASTPMPNARWRWPRRFFLGFRARSRVAAGASVGLAATAVALVLTFAVASPPAFAVTSNPDGTITITLNELSAVGALNAKLAAMGVNVRAVPVVAGCKAPARIAGSDSPPATLLANTSGFASVTVSTNIPAGQTLVLAASDGGLHGFGQIIQGPIPSCVGPPPRQ